MNVSRCMFLVHESSTTTNGTRSKSTERILKVVSDGFMYLA